MIAAEYVNRNYGLHFYARAMNVLRTVRKEYDDVMKRYDVIVMPTVTRQVPKLPTQELEDNLKGKDAVQAFNSCTKCVMCVGSPGRTHDRTFNCHPVS